MTRLVVLLLVFALFSCKPRRSDLSAEGGQSKSKERMTLDQQLRGMLEMFGLATIPPDRLLAKARDFELVITEDSRVEDDRENVVWMHKAAQFFLGALDKEQRDKIELGGRVRTAGGEISEISTEAVYKALALPKLEKLYALKSPKKNYEICFDVISCEEALATLRFMGGINKGLLVDSFDRFFAQLGDAIKRDLQSFLPSEGARYLDFMLATARVTHDFVKWSNFTSNGDGGARRPRLREASLYGQLRGEFLKLIQQGYDQYYFSKEPDRFSSRFLANIAFDQAFKPFLSELRDRAIEFNAVDLNSIVNCLKTPRDCEREFVGKLKENEVGAIQQRVFAMANEIDAAHLSNISHYLYLERMQKNDPSAWYAKIVDMSRSTSIDFEAFKRVERLLPTQATFVLSKFRNIESLLPFRRDFLAAFNQIVSNLNPTRSTYPTSNGRRTSLDQEVAKEAKNISIHIEANIINIEEKSLTMAKGLREKDSTLKDFFDLNNKEQLTSFEKRLTTLFDDFDSLVLEFMNFDSSFKGWAAIVGLQKKLADEFEETKKADPGAKPPSFLTEVNALSTERVTELQKLYSRFACMHHKVDPRYRTLQLTNADNKVFWCFSARDLPTGLKQIFYNEETNLQAQSFSYNNGNVDLSKFCPQFPNLSAIDAKFERFMGNEGVLRSCEEGTLQITQQAFNNIMLLASIQGGMFLANIPLRMVLSRMTAVGAEKFAVPALLKRKITHGAMGYIQEMYLAGALPTNTFRAYKAGLIAYDIIGVNFFQSGIMTGANWAFGRLTGSDRFQEQMTWGQFAQRQMIDFAANTGMFGAMNLWNHLGRSLAVNVASYVKPMVAQPYLQGTIAFGISYGSEVAFFSGIDRNVTMQMYKLIGDDVMAENMNKELLEESWEKRIYNAFLMVGQFKAFGIIQRGKNAQGNLEPLGEFQGLVQEAERVRLARLGPFNSKTIAQFSIDGGNNLVVKNEALRKVLVGKDAPDFYKLFGINPKGTPQEQAQALKLQEEHFAMLRRRYEDKKVGPDDPRMQALAYLRQNLDSAERIFTSADSSQLKPAYEELMQIRQ